MERFIKKGATLPALELELIQHSQIDYNEFYRKIQNATATITLENADSCIPRFKCRPMTIYEDCDICSDCPSRYYLIYNWRKKDTRKAGKYKATIEIDFHDGCGRLIAPVNDDLYIYIRD